MKNGRKDICMACSRGVGDHDVRNCPFDWKFNLLYDIVSKHSMDLDHVKTLMEDGEISNSSCGMQDITLPFTSLN